MLYIGRTNAAMHLSEYMADNGLTDAQVASAIGRSRSIVTRYRNRKLRPDWDAVIRIKEFTEGAVSPNDWVESQ